jgi:hypothetical protein
MGTHHHIGILEDKVPNGCSRHVQPKRRPVLAVVEGNPYVAFGAGQQKALARVFSDNVDRVVRQTGVYGRPGHAAVMRLVDMRVHIVDADTVDGCISSARIAMTGIDQGYLSPVGNTGRRNILPGLAAVPGDMYQPVIGAGPDRQGIYGEGATV